MVISWFDEKSICSNIKNTFKSIIQYVQFAVLRVYKTETASEVVGYNINTDIIYTDIIDYIVFIFKNDHGSSAQFDYSWPVDLLFKGLEGLYKYI